MNERQARLFRWALIILSLLVMLFAALQAVTVSTFNNTPRSTAGLKETEEVYADLHARGTETSSWEKIETGLTGNTYDVEIHNRSGMEVSTWTLRINLQGECWLNQFWNGEVEIHQQADTGEEKVQRLNLANYKKDELILDYTIDASDLLIPLKKGDYLVYYPSAAVGEMPVEAGQNAMIGMIFYQQHGAKLDLMDYTLEYHYNRLISQGVLFVVFCGLGGILLLTAGYYLSSRMAYRRAQKDLDNRVAGISCMTELYSLIYIIDRDTNKIIPVGIDEEEDKKRPKELPAGEQIKNLFVTDAKPEYLESLLAFSSLDSLPGRLAERRHIATEYESRNYGWCRIAFIAMDQEKDKLPRRILFTVQQINEEKKEMESILMQVESARLEKGESQKFMESVSAGIRTPLRSILARACMIMERKPGEEIETLASEIQQTGDMALSLVDSTLDMVRLNAGTMKLAEVPYNFRHMIDQVEDSFRTSTMNEAIDFRVQIAPQVPEMLIGDGPKLRQVLLNLLGWSLGTLESGSITLRVFGKQNAALKRVHLLISIVENGDPTGLPDEGQSTELVGGLLNLMNSGLKTADIGTGRDYYFEVEQGIPEEKKSAAGESDGKE